MGLREIIPWNTYRMCSILCICILILFIPVAVSAIDEGSDTASLIPADPESRVQIAPLMGNLPLFFLPNEGQTYPEILFTMKGPDFTLSFTGDMVIYSLPLDENSRIAVIQQFSESNPDMAVEGVNPLETRVSYFSGPKSQWHANITPYGSLVYRDIYPGIDVIYRGEQGTAKREFVVHEGADPNRIRMIYNGATQVRMTGDGGLVIRAGSGEIRETAPVCYQEVDGIQVEIPCRFDVRDDGSVSFHIGRYDPSLSLMIDPMLAYCGYIGGSNSDYSYGIAVDSSGNAYITGQTGSPQASFPEMVGPDLGFNGGNSDAFVAKVNPDGSRLVYCGYLGGNADDGGYGIAVDSSGNAYVTGYTWSTETTFPVVVGPDLSQNGLSDIFVAKVNAAGTDLDYCGYIGGSDTEQGEGIAVDSLGNAHLTGVTYSNQATFPETISTYQGEGDAFVARVNPAGSGLTLCGYIGGYHYDKGSAIAVDPQCNTYLTGTTLSDETSFLNVVGPDLTHNGGYDAFIIKTNAAGTGFDYSGFIGGEGDDDGHGIAVDYSGNAYITGSTDSTETTFPVFVGPDLTHNGGEDAFVAKVCPWGNMLFYCGYLGGNAGDYGEGIAVDSARNVYVTGYTDSTESTFPVKKGPDISYNGGTDAFIAKVNFPGTDLVYCGYIGGMNQDYGWSIAADAGVNAFITGYTDSTEGTFPKKAGPSLFYKGSDDAFVAKIHTEFGKGVFRPGTQNNWILDRSMDGTVDIRNHYGLSFDTPLVGDFNADGIADRALFRSGEWIVDSNIDGSTDLRNNYGTVGDTPLLGYMNADMIIDRAVFRKGEWIFDYYCDGSVNQRNIFGVTGDVPLLGDFNNDGTPDRALFRASASDNWIFDYNMDTTVDIRNHYGNPGDFPVIGDFNIDGITDRAVFRAGEWIIDYNMDGSVDSRPKFGMKGDIPLVWSL